MSVGSVFQSVLVRYALAQAALLPLMLLSWLALPKRASLRFQWAFHRTLVVLAIALPILLALPVSSRIVHAFGDLVLRPSGTTPASVETDTATPVKPMPFSPPPPVDTATVSEAQSVPPEFVAEAGRPAFTFADALDLLPVIFAVFSALGIAAFFVGIGRQAMRERALLRSATVIRRIGKVSVVVSDTVRSPFSTGLLRPRIYLPTGIARSGRSRRMVLAHESLHVRRVHIAWTFLERLHAALLWYNPLAHLAATNGARLRELVCDRDAGRIHGDTAYCRVLLDAAASLIGEHTTPGLANGWIGRRFLRRRIEFLSLGLGNTSHGWVFAAAPVAALAGLAVLIGCGPRVLPEPALDEPTAAGAETPSYTTLTQVEGAWPGTTLSPKDGGFPAYRDAVMGTAATGWNLGTGRMYNLWAGPEMKLVLGVNNPEGFWFMIQGSDGVEATAFNEDIHAVISGLLLHLPFLQRIWAGLRASDPDLQGETGFTIAVDVSGRVTTAEPDPAKPGNLTLARAYAASMKNWTLTGRQLVSAYLMRIPIVSYLRQNGPQSARVMTVRLGDPVAEVRWGMMSHAHPLRIIKDGATATWFTLNYRSVGTALIAVTVATDGSIISPSVLDTDVAQTFRPGDHALLVEKWPPLQPVPSGRPVRLVIVFSMIPYAVESRRQYQAITCEVFAIGSEAVRYLDFLCGGHSPPVKLELPGTLRHRDPGRVSPSGNGVAVTQRRGDAKYYRQLADPLPFDLEETRPDEYRRLAPRWQDWKVVRTACARCAAGLFDLVSALTPP